MAYLYCLRTDDESADADASYKRDYTMTFLVIVSDPTSDAAYAASCPSLPSLWAPHPTNLLARLVRISPKRRRGEPCNWEVTLTYSTDIDAYLGDTDQQEGQDPADRQQNPVDRLPDYTLTASNYTEAAATDADGKAVLNSAGDPFLPPPEIICRQFTFTVDVNYTAKAPTSLLNRVDCVNNNSFTIWGYAIAAGEARQTAFSQKKMFENGGVYYRYSHTIIWRPGRNHKTKILDMGRRMKVTRTVDFVTTTTIENIPNKVSPGVVATPVLLDGAGGVLPAGGDPQYRTFKFYLGEVAFSNL